MKYSHICAPVANRRKRRRMRSRRLRMLGRRMRRLRGEIGKRKKLEFEGDADP